MLKVLYCRREDQLSSYDLLMWLSRVVDFSRVKQWVVDTLLLLFQFSNVVFLVMVSDIYSYKLFEMHQL